MAFCTKCGKELGPDGTCDCEKTQATAAETATVEEKKDAVQEAAPAVDAAAAAPAADGKKNNKGIIYAAAAVAVVVLIIIIASVSGGNYKTPLKQFTKLVNKQSTDVYAYQEFLSAPMDTELLNGVKGIMKDSDDYADQIDSSKERLEDFYSDNDGLKLSYDISKAKKLDSDELKDISKSYKNTYKNYYKSTIGQLEDLDSEDYEDLADALDISEGSAKKLVKKIISYMKSYEDVKVSKGYEVTLRFNGKMDGDEDTTEKIKVTIIKANGEWFIYNVYDMFNQANFKDDLSSVNLYTIYSSTYMNIDSLY